MRPSHVPKNFITQRLSALLGAHRLRWIWLCSAYIRPFSKELVGMAGKCLIYCTILRSRSLTSNFIGALLRRCIPAPVAKFHEHLRPHLPERSFITVHYTYFICTCMVSSLIIWGSATPFRSVSYTDSLFLAVSAMTLAGSLKLRELGSSHWCDCRSQHGQSFYSQHLPAIHAFPLDHSRFSNLGIVGSGTCA